METVDKYLKSVGPLLPKAQRQDILDELSDEIRSQIAEQEVAFGRHLTEDELGTILQRLGNPLLVGGRYQPNQGSLVFGKVIIGRELFPFYLRMLKLTACLVVPVILVINIAMSVSKPFSFENLLGSIASQLAIYFGIETLIFAGIQRHLTRYPARWNVDDQFRPTDSKNSTAGSRFEAIVQLLFLGLITPWLHQVLWPPEVSLGIGVLAPVWHQVYWPIMIMALGTAAYCVAALLKPVEVVRHKKAYTVVSTAWLLGICSYLLMAGPWAVVVGSDPEKARAIDALNLYVFKYSLICMVVVLGGMLVWELISPRFRKKAS